MIKCFCDICGQECENRRDRAIERGGAIDIANVEDICPTCEMAADSIKVELVMRMAIADKSPNVPKGERDR